MGVKENEVSTNHQPLRLDGEDGKEENEFKEKTDKTFEFSSPPKTDVEWKSDIKVKVVVVSTNGTIPAYDYNLNTNLKLYEVRRKINKEIREYAKNGWCFLSKATEIPMSEERKMTLFDILPKMPFNMIPLNEFHFKDIQYKKLIREKWVCACVVYLYQKGTSRQEEENTSCDNTSAVIVDGEKLRTNRHEYLKRQQLSAPFFEGFSYIPADCMSLKFNMLDAEILSLHSDSSFGLIKKVKSTLNYISNTENICIKDLKDERGAVPLHYAAQNGMLEVCECLVVGLGKQSIFEKDNFFKYPLHYALYHVNLDKKTRKNKILTVCYLLQQGSDIVQRDNMGLSCLELLQALKPDILNSILCSIKLDHLNPALHYFFTCFSLSSKQYLSKAKELTKHLPYQRGSFGTTPLHLATQLQDKKCIQNLLFQGYDPSEKDIFNSLPYYIACQKGLSELIDVLMLSSFKDDVVCNGIILALRKFHVDICKAVSEKRPNLLVDEQALVYITNYLDQQFSNVRKGGKTANIENNVSKVLPLLQKFKNILGTYFHVCAMHNMKEITQQLLSLDVNQMQDTMGRTPLHEAAQNNSLDVVNLLISHGVKINATDWRGSTPLHYCCEKGHLKIVERLMMSLEIRADKKDKCGRTPVMVAAYYKKSKIVAFLVKNFAKQCHLGACDIHGQNILDYCINIDLNIAQSILTFCKSNKVEFENSSKKKLKQDTDISTLNWKQNVEQHNYAIPYHISYLEHVATKNSPQRPKPFSYVYNQTIWKITPNPSKKISEHKMVFNFCKKCKTFFPFSDTNVHKHQDCKVVKKELKPFQFHRYQSETKSNPVLTALKANNVNLAKMLIQFKKSFLSTGNNIKYTIIDFAVGKLSISMIEFLLPYFDKSSITNAIYHLIEQQSISNSFKTRQIILEKLMDYHSSKESDGVIKESLKKSNLQNYQLTSFKLAITLQKSDLYDVILLKLDNNTFSQAFFIAVCNFDLFAIQKILNKYSNFVSDLALKALPLAINELFKKFSEKFILKRDKIKSLDEFRNLYLKNLKDVIDNFPQIKNFKSFAWEIEDYNWYINNEAPNDIQVRTFFDVIFKNVPTHSISIPIMEETACLFVKSGFYITTLVNNVEGNVHIACVGIKLALKYKLKILLQTILQTAANVVWECYCESKCDSANKVEEIFAFCVREYDLLKCFMTGALLQIEKFLERKQIKMFPGCESVDIKSPNKALSNMIDVFVKYFNETDCQDEVIENKKTSKHGLLSEQMIIKYGRLLNVFNGNLSAFSSALNARDLKDAINNDEVETAAIEGNWTVFRKMVKKGATVTLKTFLLACRGQKQRTFSQRKHEKSIKTNKERLKIIKDICKLHHVDVLAEEKLLFSKTNAFYEACFGGNWDVLSYLFEFNSIFSVQAFSQNKDRYEWIVQLPLEIIYTLFGCICKHLDKINLTHLTYLLNRILDHCADCTKVVISTLSINKAISWKTLLELEPETTEGALLNSHALLLKHRLLHGLAKFGHNAEINAVLYDLEKNQCLHKYINVLDHTQKSPLWYALQSNNWETAKLLMLYGAKLLTNFGLLSILDSKGNKYHDIGNGIFEKACYQKQAKKCLENSTIFKSKDKTGFHDLYKKVNFQSSHNEQKSRIKCILKYVLIAEKRQCDLIHIACSCADEELVVSILEKRPTAVMLKDSYKNIPYVYSISSANTTCIQATSIGLTHETVKDAMHEILHVLMLSAFTLEERVAIFQRLFSKKSNAYLLEISNFSEKKLHYILPEDTMNYVFEAIHPVLKIYTHEPIEIRKNYYIEHVLLQIMSLIDLDKLTVDQITVLCMLGNVFFKSIKNVSSLDFFGKKYNKEAYTTGEILLHLLPPRFLHKESKQNDTIMSLISRILKEHSLTLSPNLFLKLGKNRSWDVLMRMSLETNKAIFNTPNFINQNINHKKETSVFLDLLKYACLQDQVEPMRTLISIDRQSHLIKQCMSACLFLSACKGKENVFNFLLREGTDVVCEKQIVVNYFLGANFRDNWSLLEYAIQGKSCEILLSVLAFYELTSQLIFEEPLQCLLLGVKSGEKIFHHVEDFFLKNTNYTFTELDFCKIVLIAAKSGMVNICMNILERNPNILPILKDKRDSNILHYCSWFGLKELHANVLKSAEFLVEAKNAEGWSPSDYAFAMGHHDMVLAPVSPDMFMFCTNTGLFRHLLDKTSQKDVYNEKAELGKSFKRLNFDIESLIEQKCIPGANIWVETSASYLRYSLKTNPIYLTKLFAILAKFKCDDVLNHLGKVCGDLSLYENIFQMLHENLSPLAHAVNVGNVHAIGFLEKYSKLLTNPQTSLGENVLHVAIKSGQVNALKHMVMAYPNITDLRDAEDASGLTPLACAVALGNPASLRILMNNNILPLKEHSDHLIEETFEYMCVHCLLNVGIGWSKCYLTSSLKEDNSCREINKGDLIKSRLIANCLLFWSDLSSDIFKSYLHVMGYSSSPESKKLREFALTNAQYYRFLRHCEHLPCDVKGAGQLFAKIIAHFPVIFLKKHVHILKQILSYTQDGLNLFEHALFSGNIDNFEFLQTLSDLDSNSIMYNTNDGFPDQIRWFLEEKFSTGASNLVLKPRLNVHETFLTIKSKYILRVLEKIDISEKNIYNFDEQSFMKHHLLWEKGRIWVTHLCRSSPVIEVCSYFEDNFSKKIQSVNIQCLQPNTNEDAKTTLDSTGTLQLKLKVHEEDNQVSFLFDTSLIQKSMEAQLKKTITKDILPFWQNEVMDVFGLNLEIKIDWDSIDARGKNIESKILLNALLGDSLTSELCGLGDTLQKCKEIIKSMEDHFQHETINNILTEIDIQKIIISYCDVIPQEKTEQNLNQAIWYFTFENGFLKFDRNRFPLWLHLHMYKTLLDSSLYDIYQILHFHFDNKDCTKCIRNKNNLPLLGIKFDWKSFKIEKSHLKQLLGTTICHALEIVRRECHSMMRLNMDAETICISGTKSKEDSGIFQTGKKLSICICLYQKTKSTWDIGHGQSIKQLKTLEEKQLLHDLEDTFKTEKLNIFEDFTFDIGPEDKIFAVIDQQKTLPLIVTECWRDYSNPLEIFLLTKGIIINNLQKVINDTIIKCIDKFSINESNLTSAWLKWKLELKQIDNYLPFMAYLVKENKHTQWLFKSFLCSATLDLVRNSNVIACMNKLYCILDTKSFGQLLQNLTHKCKIEKEFVEIHSIFSELVVMKTTAHFTQNITFRIPDFVTILHHGLLASMNLVFNDKLPTINIHWLSFLEHLQKKEMQLLLSKFIDSFKDTFLNLAEYKNTGENLSCVEKMNRKHTLKRLCSKEMEIIFLSENNLQKENPDLFLSQTFPCGPYITKVGEKVKFIYTDTVQFMPFNKKLEQFLTRSLELEQLYNLSKMNQELKPMYDGYSDSQRNISLSLIEKYLPLIETSTTILAQCFKGSLLLENQIQNFQFDSTSGSCYVSYASGNVILYLNSQRREWDFPKLFFEVLPIFVKNILENVGIRVNLSIVNSVKKDTSVTVKVLCPDFLDKVVTKLFAETLASAPNEFQINNIPAEKATLLQDENCVDVIFSNIDKSEVYRISHKTHSFEMNGRLNPWSSTINTNFYIDHANGEVIITSKKGMILPLKAVLHEEDYVVNKRFITLQVLCPLKNEAAREMLDSFLKSPKKFSLNKSKPCAAKLLKNGNVLELLFHSSNVDENAKLKHDEVALRLKGEVYYVDPKHIPKEAKKVKLEMKPLRKQPFLDSFITERVKQQSVIKKNFYSYSSYSYLETQIKRPRIAKDRHKSFSFEDVCDLEFKNRGYQLTCLDDKIEVSFRCKSTMCSCFYTLYTPLGRVPPGYLVRLKPKS